MKFDDLYFTEDEKNKVFNEVDTQVEISPEQANGFWKKLFSGNGEQKFYDTLVDLIDPKKTAKTSQEFAEMAQKDFVPVLIDARPDRVDDISEPVAMKTRLPQDWFSCGYHKGKNKKAKSVCNLCIGGEYQDQIVSRLRGAKSIWPKKQRYYETVRNAKDKVLIKTFDKEGRTHILQYSWKNKRVLMREKK